MGRVSAMVGRRVVVTVGAAAALTCRAPGSREDAAADATPASAVADARPAVEPAPDIGFHGRLDPEATPAGRDDVDGDGREDCWEARYEGGSGFGGVRLAIRFDCAGEPQVVDTFGSFAEFLAAPRLPAALASRPGAIDGVIDRLFGAAHRVCEDGTCAAPETSFLWLLDELAGRRRAPLAIGPLTGVWHHAPRWQPGAPALPPSQVLAVWSTPDRVAAVRELEPGEPAAAGEEPAGAPFALIAYHARGHLAGDRRLARAGGCAAWTLWTTAHAVAVEDAAAGRWSWVYVSTGRDKLRWPSVARVACGGGVVAIERDASGGARDLIVVAPETGGVGTIALAPEAAWSVAGDRLELGDAAPSLAALAEMLAPSAWQRHLDLDDDGAADRVVVDLAGGKRCCHALTLALATGGRVEVPFEIEGGHVGGPGLARPEQLSVGDHDGDGRPELRIAVDARDPRAGGADRVLVDVREGRLRVRAAPG